MIKEPTPEEKKQRNKNMDRYDSFMNPAHYSAKGWEKKIKELNGKCLDGTESKATKKEI